MSSEFGVDMSCALVLTLFTQSKNGPFRPSIEEYKRKYEESKEKVLDALRK